MRRCLSPQCDIRHLHAVLRRRFSSSRAARKRTSIVELLRQNATKDEVEVYGWIRSLRRQKRVAFAAVEDGSTLEPLQAVLKPEQSTELSHGAAVKFTGSWQASLGREQHHELQVRSTTLLGTNDAEANPIQPKYQTAEFLRSIPHLRARVSTNALLLRLRSQLIASLTRFFENEGFVQTHTPIITSSDCEGAGEVFTVSSNPSTGVEQKHNLRVQAPTDHFFRTPKYLTVSAQLHLEALAQAVTKVWTLSPTFRAEKSDTPRHLSEFYMLEAEVCFLESMSEVMDIVESMLRTATNDLQCSSLGQQLLQARKTTVQQDTEHNTNVVSDDTLRQRWTGMVDTDWPRITYAEAIETLQQAVADRKVTFIFQPSYDEGLQAEHERYVASAVGRGRPVFVTDYPRAQKPFYMPRSSYTSGAKGNGATVACFDLLVPDLCEIVGGSMREHHLQELLDGMNEKGIAGTNLQWYQDLRRYGSVPHGGFGLGFDRLMCYLGGVNNIRDVVAFPRWYGRCDC